MSVSQWVDRPLDVTLWSRARVRLLLAGTLWSALGLLIVGPVAYVGLLVLDPPGTALVVAFFALYALTALLSAALSVVYAIVAVKSPMSSSSRILWALAVLVVGTVALPVAFYSLVWQPRSRAARPGSIAGNESTRPDPMD
jgi:hypothetical protein